jgi:predicted phosphoribosyltransferase
MGAIALGDVEYINHGVLSGQYVPDWAINQVIAEERQELARRNELYRQGRPPPSLKGKTALVVDDGLATGATMRAAILSLRQAGAVQIVAAVPVGAGAACRELEEADLVVCPWMPEPFYGVGQWYRDFSQTTDEQVQAILKERVEAAS